VAQLQCTVVTPEATVWDAPVDFLVLPLADGEIGLAPKHGPLIGRLGFGEMRLKQGEKTSHYYLDGGFVQLVNDQVSVLTHHAIPASDLNEDQAQKLLADAEKKPTNTDEALALRARATAQARARLQVIRRFKAIKRLPGQ